MKPIDLAVCNCETGVLEILRGVVVPENEYGGYDVEAFLAARYGTDDRHHWMEFSSIEEEFIGDNWQEEEE